MLKLKSLFGKTAKITALVAAIGITAALIVAGCGGGEKKAEAPKNDKKIVKVAHRSDYVPYCYINENKQPDGFEVAVLQEVAKKLPQYEFKFIATSDDDLLIGVESGKYNVGVKGSWYTKARKDKYIFPKNYIAASVIGITFRKENADKIHDLESFAKFSGKLVPIAPQNAQYAVVQQYNKEHPDAQVKLLPSENFKVADAYTWVLEGRYDAYLNIELNHYNNVVKETGKYHKFADKFAYARHMAIPTYPLFNKKDAQLAADYDKAVDELKKEGKILELEKKYFGEDIFKYIKGDGIIEK
ncbi:MAG: transporter substrate-binding domain-containing protein [Phascolarctobacterium sp.]